jgi:membrane peptidoglycan carboxypeptidase
MKRTDRIRNRLRRWLRPLAGLVLLLTGLLWAAYAWLAVDLPAPDELYRRRSAPNTRILDRHGRLLYEIIDPHAGHHTPLALEQIPLACQQATIATEDANFYTNPGVDLGGILRAAWINLRGGEVLAGGSTITQQLARNLLLDPQERAERTLKRKLRESILAWRIARRYDKDQILTLYLNETYYGNLAYGIEAAARAYFGKPATDLDLAECALLAGLPQAPALYDPLVDLQAAHERQEVVLNLMRKHGYINEEQVRLATAERLHFAATPFPIQAPHFVMYVRAWLEGEYGLEAIYQRGLVVTTTLDLDWQHTAEAVARNRLAQLREPPLEKGAPPKNVNNAALVALDPHSGEILTMLGSPDYFDPQIDGAVNAALALRQPGSAIKPVTYAAAFDPRRAETLTPGSAILDVRTSFPTREGLPYVPVNYDHRYHGPVSAREALASSYNLPAVKVLDMVGVDEMTALARRMGITTFDDPPADESGEGKYGLALTLGGGEVRLLELTAAFAAFANGGQRIEPIAVLAVDDAQGHPLYRAREQTGEQVLSPQVAYLISHILSDEQARTPAFGEGSVLRLSCPDEQCRGSRPAAAKTGTTTDWRDNWTVGYTPAASAGSAQVASAGSAQVASTGSARGASAGSPQGLTVGVWVGNADNRPMERVSGVSGAGPIWHDFMELVLLDRPAVAFQRPPGIVEVEICSLSGLLPTPYCPHTRTELFIAGTEPKLYDNWYQPFTIDSATGLLADANTPPERVETQVYVVLPEQAREWAHQQGWPDPPTASLALSAQVRDADFELVMTRPDPGSIYHLSPNLPLSAQRVEVSARPAGGVAIAEVTLYADGVPLQSFRAPPYRTFWTLEPGEHSFEALGRAVDGRRLQSEAMRILVREE